MRKALILFLIILSVESNAQLPGTFFPDKEPMSNIQQGRYADSILMDDISVNNDGNDLINNYVNRSAKILDRQARYFTIDASTLLSYLINYECSFVGGALDSQIHHIIFCLGKSGSQTNLYIVGANENHNYLFSQNGVLQCMTCQSKGGNCLATTTLSANATQYQPYSGNGNTIFNKKFPPLRAIQGYSNYITVDSFDTVKARYYTAVMNTNVDTDKSIQFYFDAGTLAHYIYDLNGIQDLQLILGRSIGDGTTTLVIVGNDASGNQIYLKDNNNRNMVMEHCYPCPSVCPIDRLFAQALMQKRRTTSNYMAAVRTRSEILKMLNGRPVGNTNAALQKNIRTKTDAKTTTNKSKSK